MIDKLKQYFKNVSKDQLTKDWKKVEYYSEVGIKAVDLLKGYETNRRIKR